MKELFNLGQSPKSVSLPRPYSNGRTLSTEEFEGFGRCSRGRDGGCGRDGR